MKSDALLTNLRVRSSSPPFSLTSTMVDTPWGSSERLRERRLKPGPGRSREAVEANQRERLFGAMVACVAQRGYAATRLDDLVELSGVSTASFYRLFASKDACFLAASEELLAAALVVTTPDDHGTWEDRFQEGLAAFAELIVAQPAAAKMLLIDSYAAGPEATEAIDRTLAELERRAIGLANEAPKGPGLPDEIPASLVGAVGELVRDRLRRGRARVLPGLMNTVAQVALAYRAPTEPLTYGGRLPRAKSESLEVPSAADRAIRAFAVVAAERGYQAASVEEVVKRASMSPTTFYAEFADKREVMLAAIDSAGAQMVAATLPAFRRNPDWPSALRTAFIDLLAYLASRPALTRLVFVEAYAAGPEALQRRAEALEPLTALLAPGRVDGKGLPQGAGEVVWAAIIAQIGRRVREAGPNSLPALEPILTFMAISPYLGPKAAGAAARSGGRARRTHHVEAVLAFYEDPESDRFETALGFGAATPEELATRLDVSAEDARQLLGKMLDAGLIESVEGHSKDEPIEGAYRFSGDAAIDRDSVSEMSIAERQRVAARVANGLQAELGESLEAGTLSLRPEHVLVRMPMNLDEEGWREVSDLLEQAMADVLDVYERSAERLADSGEAPMRATAGLALFEMPRRQRAPRHGE
jgi:AcrR family transcriptional regulator